MLPILISVSVAPGSYFFWESAGNNQIDGGRKCRQSSDDEKHFVSPYELMNICVIGDLYGLDSVVNTVRQVVSISTSAPRVRFRGFVRFVNVADLLSGPGQSVGTSLCILARRGDVLIGQRGPYPLPSLTKLLLAVGKARTDPVLAATRQPAAEVA